MSRVRGGGPTRRDAALGLLAGGLGLRATGPLAADAAPRPPLPPVPAGWVHAYAAFGEPKYPPGFAHFDYVNPDAPKGGTLYLRNPDRRSSFDKFNTFTARGNAPPGVGIFMMQSLGGLSADEPRTMYGQLAEAMKIEPDLSAISFRLHPKARFYNGDPVTAADVLYSFETQSGRLASPVYSAALEAISKAVVVDERTVRFELKERNSDTLFLAGGIAVYSHKWGLKPDGSHTPFDEIVSEWPITSGPYTIAVADSGRRIEFQRDPNYWARDLGIGRGFYNFDRIVYRSYEDEAVAIEAFKAHEFDILRVYGARSWVRRLQGPKWNDGRIVKRLFPLGTGQGLQAFELNLRRPIFKDIRAREAVGLAFDYDTNNRYRLYKRANSVFNNSPFAAVGLPSPAELALLEPFRAGLPPQVFGPPFVAPRTGGDPARLRQNLLAARALLQQAGWALGADNRLRNAKGEAFDIEYLAPGDAKDDPTMNAWAQNLAKLGIRLNVRNVDFALYSRRLKVYDFDMVTIVEGTFTLPSPLNYISLYGSKSADEEGNNNFRGVKSPAVDRLLEAMNAATTLEAFQDACRAFDRVVMWSHWQVPEVYSDQEAMTYWDRFGMPATLPLFFNTDLPPEDDSQLPWPISCWWVKGATGR